jgi:L-lactate utilization protein LutC
VTATLLKFGGELLEQPERLAELAAMLARVTTRSRLAVVHGGGREIDAALARIGVPKRQVDGLRVTDDQTMGVVVEVLAGTVNTRLVAAITAAGGRAVGLTGADAGLAETGSVVIASGPGRSRMASLLVPVHVAVLRVDRLVDSISTLLATRGDLVAAGSNLVAITGPSRTADIEHTLSRGVHGPGEVHVILFEA